ncbi:MAG: SDR family oxidoreductase [Pseudomonadota bacterium]
MEKPVTVIIGLGRTVGDAVARRFHEAGHDVLAVDPDRALLDELYKTIGNKIQYHQGVIHTRLGLRNALAAALETFGYVDHVVCIPDLPEPDTLRDLAMETFESTLIQSVRGAVQALRVFSEIMLEQIEDPSNAIDRARQSGSFTFVLSLGAAMVQPGWFSESVTQSAILGVIKAGAVELAKDGVRVNGITALRPRAEGREPWLISRTPMGRPALAEEIAEAALFLSNDQSAILTGQSLILDGGRTALSGLIETAE